MGSLDDGGPQRQSEKDPDTKYSDHDENTGVSESVTSPTDVCVEPALGSTSAEENGHGKGTEMKPLVEREDVSCVGEQHFRADDNGEGDADDNGDVKIEIDIEKEDDSLLQDRGWAWCVVLGGFLSHLVTGGFERSDGVMFLKFTDKFQESAQLTSWPAALCTTLRLVMGPAASALNARFSARTSCMVGTFIFTLGVIVSGFAPNISFLFFSYGILQGIGRGLVYAPGLIIVGMYMNRHRGLGVGLSTAGVGAGTFIFPPLVEFLFEHFGFSGAFLVLGGLALNLCVVSALFRPLSVHRNIVFGHRKKTAPDDKETVALTSADPTNTRPHRKHSDDIEILNNPPSDAKVPSQVAAESLNGAWQCRTENTRRRNVHETSVPSHNSKKKSRKAILLKSALQTCFPVDQDRKDKSKRKLIEWSLLKIPSFLFYCFSICLFTAAFKSAFIFLPALAQSKGLSEIKAAYLLSISGVTDTIARILSGFILDKEKIRPFRPIAYNGVIFVITVVSFLSPFMTTFAEFAVLFGLYGALTGTYGSQKSVILVDILGQDKLNSSFGLIMCFQGLGTIIGPPLSGLFKDIFGRYNEAFFLGGAAMAASGGLMIVSNVYHATRQRRQNSTTAAA